MRPPEALATAPGFTLSTGLPRPLLCTPALPDCESTAHRHRERKRQGRVRQQYRRLPERRASREGGRGSGSMISEDRRSRPLETAPEWSDGVFDNCTELTALLETHSYRFARTMPGAPHSYTLKRTWESEELFVEALRKMRAVERVEELFGGRWYRRFTANGYKYWTMGANLDHILINRAIHDFGLDPYASVADAYDLGVRTSKAEVDHAQRLYDSLEIWPDTDILDIGCGTGTLIDFRFADIDPARYTGIDPSRGMLGVFAEKHPEFRGRLVRTGVQGLLAAVRVQIRSCGGPVRCAVLSHRPSLRFAETPVVSQAWRNGRAHVLPGEARRYRRLPPPRREASRRIWCARER